MDLNTYLEMSLASYLATISVKNDAKALGLSQSSRPEFGDFQLNGFFSMARDLGRSPHDLADSFLQAVRSSPPAWWGEGWISGKGFISLRLCQRWLAKALIDFSLKGLDLCSTAAHHPVIIDYSSPNVAKTMAVHHMRSTFLGDAMSRILAYLGHKVIKVNHLGDWGTQFGLLLAWIEHHDLLVESLNLSALESIYQRAQLLAKNDEHFHRLARKKVVELHNKAPEAIRIWRQLVALTLAENQKLYDALGILLTPAEAVGESYYETYLPELLHDLVQKGLAQRLADGSIVALLEDTFNKLGEPMGVILKKSDGAYLYASTDLACVWYRANVLKGDRLLYCVDSRQKQHFDLVWRLARKANYIPEHVQVQHLAFGMMLGKDGKPFKTRAGGSLKLSEFFEEAKEKVSALVAEKAAELSPQEQVMLINRLAIGVMKYADLMRNRLTDYRFNWEDALALEGNTAPYLFYARVRAKMLLDRAKFQGFRASERLSKALSDEIDLTLGENERRLAIQLLGWQHLIAQAGRTGQPHLICTYLYELAGLFSIFYEQCQILTLPETSSLKDLRLLLVHLTEASLRIGLDLLGITVVDRM